MTMSSTGLVNFSLIADSQKVTNLQGAPELLLIMINFWFISNQNH